LKKYIAFLLAFILILTGAFFAYAIAETAEGTPRAAPMVDLTGVIIAVLALVFDFLLAWIARVIVPPIKCWLDENTTEKQKGLIWDAITKMVDAAEQIIIGPGQGARKMAYVQAGLQQRGYTVDSDMIEAAVKRMNDRTKLMIGSAFDITEDEETTKETEVTTEDDGYHLPPLEEWPMEMIVSFCVDNGIPHEGCVTKEDYIQAIVSAAAPVAEPETGCGVKDYCDLDENGNPIPEEPQSANE